MKPLTWKKDYELGIEKIDEQHKGLVTIINDIQTGWQEGLSSSSLDKILDRLMEYTEKHFSAEEDLMSKHEYPDLDNHRASHQAFISMINNFRNANPEMSPVVLQSLYDFLKIWLTSHIMASDRAYLPFVTTQKT